MKIDTFSFRFGDTTGFMEWFRYDRAQGLQIDHWDGKMTKKQCMLTEEDLAELAAVIEKNGIDQWNGFCKLELCMCSGNSWVLHVTDEDGGEIHAMGHSEGPEGFTQGKKALETFFDRFWRE